MQFAQESRDVALAIAHRRARPPDDLLRHPQPRRNIEASRFTGQPDVQFVRRRQRPLVEAHGRIQHAVGIRPINFERDKMRGSQRECARCPEVVDHRYAKRAPLFRIGCRADLIEQHQRVRRHVCNHFADMRNVRRKSAQALLDRLIVADVRQHLLKNWKLSFTARHGQAGLRHERQQSGGLERHRLSARVRPADEQRAALGVKLQADRYSSLALPPQNVLQQRMPRVL